MVSNVPSLPRLEDDTHPQGTCSKGCAVVRVLASHQCGPGSNPGVNAICGLSLFVVGSFLCSEVFVRLLQFSPLLKIQHFQILIRSGTHGHFYTSYNYIFFKSSQLRGAGGRFGLPSFLNRYKPQGPPLGTFNTKTATPNGLDDVKEK